MNNIDKPVSSGDSSLAGVIFDIKRFAIHDGPGIRTTVFFKGCPLNCLWCHNPESISPDFELIWREVFCISCGICVKACPEKALSFDRTTGRLSLDKGLCPTASSAHCWEACPTEALQVVGKSISAVEILAELEKDRVFYDNSGGGVTFSGGEPLFQSDFLAECLILCRNAGLHTVVDSSCYARPEIIEQISPLADMFLCDIKHFDSKAHKKYTGVDNRQILANIRRISELGLPIIIRIPMIPGINDDIDNLKAIRAFASELDSVLEIEYLPYNSGGAGKREMIM